MKARLEYVLGGNIRATASESVAKGGAERSAFDEDETPAPAVKKAAPPQPTKKPAPVKEDGDDAEDALSYFEKLAQDD